jgi:hypothetical protein
MARLGHVSDGSENARSKRHAGSCVARTFGSVAVSSWERIGGSVNATSSGAASTAPAAAATAAASPPRPMVDGINAVDPEKERLRI